jgi:hypothetical protein
VLPNDPLPLHRHEHPRVIVAPHGDESIQVMVVELQGEMKCPIANRPWIEPRDRID